MSNEYYADVYEAGAHMVNLLRGDYSTDARKKEFAASIKGGDLINDAGFYTREAERKQPIEQQEFGRNLAGEKINEHGQTINRFGQGVNEHGQTMAAGDAPWEEHSREAFRLFAEAKPEERAKIFEDMDKLTQAERVKIDYTIVKGATDRHTQEYQERVAERRSFHDIFRDPAPQPAQAQAVEKEAPAAADTQPLFTNLKLPKAAGPAGTQGNLPLPPSGNVETLGQALRRTGNLPPQEKEKEKESQGSAGGGQSPAPPPAHVKPIASPSGLGALGDMHREVNGRDRRYDSQEEAAPTQAPAPQVVPQGRRPLLGDVLAAARAQPKQTPEVPAQRRRPRP